MITFKEFLSEAEKEEKEITGFATIHKDDDSDKHLHHHKKHKKDKELTGFATIHKDDDSDKELKEAVKSKDAYHKKLEVHLKTSKKEKLAPFKHHLDLNNDYMEDLEDKQSTYNPDEDYDKDGYSNDSEVKSAVQDYTAASTDINKHLIRLHGAKTKPKMPMMQKRIKEISSVTNNPKNAIKQSTIVHSGVGESFSSKLEKSKVGQKIHFPAFTSTSTHIGIAKNFVGQVYKKNTAHEHVLHFHLPKGFSKGRYVNNISENQGEHEVIIDKGTKWKKAGYHADVETHETVHHHHLVPA